MSRAWRYTPPDPSQKLSIPQLPSVEGPNALNFGTYQRQVVSNVESTATLPDGRNSGRTFFDLGLRLMLAYQHEEAVKCFLSCLVVAPHCALAHGMVALCHCPNYNFNGDAYYDSTYHPAEDEVMDGTPHERLPNGEEMTAEEAALEQMMCLFPSQRVAERYSKLALEKVEELRKMGRAMNGTKRKQGRGKHRVRSDRTSELNEPLPFHVQRPSASSVTTVISDVECKILSAIRTLTCNPGVDPGIAEEIVGRPYADALRSVRRHYPHDAEVNYLFAESLMVMNAWSLYEYPSGKPLSRDISEIEDVLETALKEHPEHAGLCHLYVHLSEMSTNPSRALNACAVLRKSVPDAGHLVHMATHIDVLIGDYESCVCWNYEAIQADQRAMKCSPDTAGTLSFYFGYIVHNYHMLVYGCILGGMERIAMEVATTLNGYLYEDLFVKHPDLTAYLESYSALDVHVMVRFGRWQQILQTALPRDPQVMLYRSTTLRFARALALANLGKFTLAKREAGIFDALRQDLSTENRILHNNSVADLLAVDAPMMRGEIAYHEGQHELAFTLLRKAVALQDRLKYDEPWGKMQPIRHALGGLLLDRFQIEEAESVFREDLRFHPRNPWGLVGLIRCLEYKRGSISAGFDCCGASEAKKVLIFGKRAVTDDISEEIEKLKADFIAQRKSKWADFDVVAPCACCTNCSRSEVI